jgi:uncharacterized protein (DUF427 family)
MTERPVLFPGPDHPITVEPHRGRVVVTRDGWVVADTSAALVLREGSYPPVFYIPRADADFAVLAASDHQTYCPYKGEASYFTITAGDVPATDAVWSYEQPYDAVAEIKEHLAFYPHQVEIQA